MQLEANQMLTLSYPFKVFQTCIIKVTLSICTLRGR